MENQILDFISEKFGFSGKLKKLAGYEDSNFLLTLSNEKKYVIKLTSDLNSEEFIDSQRIIFEELKHLSEYSFPEVITGLDGQCLYRFITKENEVYLLRVLTFIEGNFLSEKTTDDQSLQSFGKMLGSIDKQLEGMEIPAIQARREEWDLQYFTDNAKYVKYIRDKSKHRFVEHILLQYKQNVLHRIPDLKKGIIHNDANDWNVILTPKNGWGIIDFGDMAYTLRINEVAIAASYISMDCEDPISRVALMLKGYHDIYPLIKEEIEILYYLIAARISTTVCKAAYSIRNNPENTYINVHESKAWDLLEKWISISPDLAEKLFFEACGFEIEVKNENDIFTEKRNHHISKSLSLSYSEPIHMVRGAFQYMFDQNGKTYVDLVNNIMHVGHCHPRVVEAAHRQMSMLNTNTRYLYKSLNLYAEELLDTFPDKLNKIYFVNSGSAASDLALRLARNFTRRKNMVVMEHGYHGNTTAAIEVSPYKFNGKGGNGPESHIHIAPIPDIYHADFDEEDPELARFYASKIDTYANDQLAGFICESVIGCGGQVVLPNGYLKEIYQKIRAVGGICIADEVQTGFGRIGSKFWAFETQQVIPDMVIIGKPMGNGHPLAAVVTTDEISNAFENGMEFFSSFGGNPVSCEIGRSVLNVIRDENLMDNANEVGKFLLNGFNTLKANSNLVGNGRGMGLFLGLELIKDGDINVPAQKEAKMIINRMKDKGFLLSTDGPYNNVLKIKPPLCINIKNAHDLLENLDETLTEIESV